MYQHEEELSFCTVMLSGYEGSPTLHVLAGELHCVQLVLLHPAQPEEAALAVFTVKEIRVPVPGRDYVAGLAIVVVLKNMDPEAVPA